VSDLLKFCHSLQIASFKVATAWMGREGLAPEVGFLPHWQQMLGAPFKPYFGLSGIVALDFPLPIQKKQNSAEDLRLGPSR
jgi:hypothetical protein